MLARKLLICRGNGKAYVGFLLQNMPSGTQISVIARTSTGNLVPAYWCTSDKPSGIDEQEGVLVLPLLETASITATFFAVNAEGHVLNQVDCRISRINLALMSKYNHFTQGERCEELRTLDESNPRTIKTDLLLCMNDGDETVLRIQARIPQKNETSQKVVFHCFDGRGTPYSVEPIFFEDQVIPGNIFDGYEHVLTTSFRLPSSLNCFVIGIDVDNESLESGFFAVGPGERNSLIKEFLIRTKNASYDDDYRRWWDEHKVTEAQLMTQSQVEFSYEPLISIVVPCFEPQISYLKAMLQSVKMQSYRQWELILVDSNPEQSGVKEVVDLIEESRIKRIDCPENLGIVGNTNVGIRESSGDYIAFLDYDDLITPNALYEYIAAINKIPHVGALYCDEDVFEHEGNYKLPVFKSDFNRDLLYCHNYVTHFLMVRKSVLDEIGLSSDEVNGAQDYDMILRVSETDHPIVHVPHVLYHWRMHVGSTSGDNAESKPYAHTAGQLALTRHFERRGIPVKVKDGAIPYTYRIVYILPHISPRVDIIIPSKDHTDVLDRCIKSILKLCTYDNYRILIVENNSTEEETFAYYERIQKERDLVRVVVWDEVFNYSKVINFGASCSDAEYFLFLNNDTEMISSNFIEEMLGYLQRPEVGVVGAKLYFHDKLVQHAGMLIGPHDTVVHINQNLPATHGGYLSRAERPGNFSSVTGACQMVSREVFKKVGGYSEEFAIGFNDADFCCRVIQAGFLVVFTPYAELYHYEFISRGREEGNAEKMQRWQQERKLMMKKWSKYFDEVDPFSNPNLKRDNIYFALS